MTAPVTGEPRRLAVRILCEVWIACLDRIRWRPARIPAPLYARLEAHL